MYFLLPGLRPLLSVVALGLVSTAVVAQTTTPRVDRAREQPEQPVREQSPARPDAPARPERREPSAVLGLRQALADLDDADAAVREAARLKLMGMRRRDLESFQKLVQESQPLMPSQAAVLRQIVTHVYLAGEAYDTTNAEGFLGVKMQETSVRLPAADGADQFAPSVGVVIVERMPGFVGSRMLVDGDVILGVVERPDVRTLGMYEFQMVVKSVTPGTTIHFQVMRQGQVIRVPVAPDPRPFEADGLMQDLIYRRQRQADDYWEKSFAKVLREGVG
jgi:hypothetical protein